MATWASSGGPAQSPTDQMPGLVVRYWSSTWMKPRSSVTPMPSRPMPSMLARTPTAISTRSDVTVSFWPSAVVNDVVTVLPLTLTPVVLAPV